jgi:hypothetical protein
MGGREYRHVDIPRRRCGICMHPRRRRLQYSGRRRAVREATQRNAIPSILAAHRTRRCVFANTWGSASAANRDRIIDRMAGGEMSLILGRLHCGLRPAAGSQAFPPSSPCSSACLPGARAAHFARRRRLVASIRFFTALAGVDASGGNTGGTGRRRTAFFFDHCDASEPGGPTTCCCTLCIGIRVSSQLLLRSLMHARQSTVALNLFPSSTCSSYSMSHSSWLAVQRHKATSMMKP